MENAAKCVGYSFYRQDVALLCVLILVQDVVLMQVENSIGHSQFRTHNLQKNTYFLPICCIKTAQNKINDKTQPYVITL